MLNSLAESPDASLTTPRNRYLAVRSFTESICEPLETEDYTIQSMPDVSPTRWHLAHTTWFFETFVLIPHCRGYQSPHLSFTYLFNSYYNTLGRQFPRGRRGVLSRPTVAEIWEYRRSVDGAMLDLLASDNVPPAVLAIVQLGNHHEQQHQELILTDIKHVFSCNPLDPAYRRRDEGAGSGPVLAPANWLTFEEGLMDIGFGGAGFCFDNERPRHQTFVHPFRIQGRLVTNREYLEFVEDGGYQRPELWLSLGWNAVSQQSWESPLYWRHTGADWYEFTLAGLQPLVPDQAVCHVSLFEADAYARWVKARLPTEFEWECAAAREAIAGTFAESNRLHPAAATATQGHLRQCFGDVWEWTSSQYQAYPGYRPASGAFGEYNGKFMCNQFVLRGGSCATPESHMRATYRNFFPPDARWQFSGIRLAE